MCFFLEFRCRYLCGLRVPGFMAPSKHQADMNDSYCTSQVNTNTERGCLTGEANQGREIKDSPLIKWKGLHRSLEWVLNELPKGVKSACFFFTKTHQALKCLRIFRSKFIKPLEMVHRCNQECSSCPLATCLKGAPCLFRFKCVCARYIVSLSGGSCWMKPSSYTFNFFFLVLLFYFPNLLICSSM